MSSKDVRRGIANAKFNEKQSNILMAEVVLIAIMIGVGTQSWWVFGVGLIVLLASLHIPYIAIPLMVILSAAWGAIGYGIGSAFGSLGAEIVIASIAFLSGLGVHMSGLQWVTDIGSD